MKAVILAGGLGTRLSEETRFKPKPMITIGNQPILWHIMNIYAKHGVKEFIICGGYKYEVIVDYFTNYIRFSKSITINTKNNSIVINKGVEEDWLISIVDTGNDTMTGGRLKRVAEYLKGEEIFCFTYGDGLSDLDINKLIEFHKLHGKLATMTAVYPPGRFGAIDILNNNQIKSFKEKPKGDGSMINGGFFVLSPKVIDLIENDSTTWENEPLETLANMGELIAFKHTGFWQPMDTLKDKNYLETLIRENRAPWIKDQG